MRHISLSLTLSIIELKTRTRQMGRRIGTCDGASYSLALLYVAREVYVPSYLQTSCLTIPLNA